MKIPFPTTPEQIQSIPLMIIRMYNVLSEEFVVSAAKLALIDQGVYELMLQWFEASKFDHQDIEAEIQKSINDYAMITRSSQNSEPIHQDQMTINYLRTNPQEAYASYAAGKEVTVLDEAGTVYRLMYSGMNPYLIK